MQPPKDLQVLPFDMNHCPTGSAQVPAIVRSVLWIDCSGGLVVGTLMLVFAGWLEGLYQLPASLYFTMAAANVCYGLGSLALASRKSRPVGLVSALAIANAIWGGVCLIAAVSMAGRASLFGLAHLLSECVVVVWLAQIEWRYRALIAAK